MKKGFVFFISGLLTSVSVLYAQTSPCESCGKLEIRPDFCYRSQHFPLHCAAFSEGLKTFSLYNGKKVITLSHPDTFSLRAIASLSKKYKLTVEDALFLVEAFPEWEKAKKRLGFTFLSDGLGYKILKEGNGPKPTKGDRVRVHYKGYLEDGTVFDSSYDRGQPFEFVVGVGQVIRGWEEGIPLFSEGGKGILLIPPELGYGSRGVGSIPPNSTLFFEVEIVKINP